MELTHAAIRMLCLQAIRTVFNVAVGADAGDMQRTARNALLQMLNTVLKHVTLYPLVSCAALGSVPMCLGFLSADVGLSNAVPAASE
jgi:hypothetical protein